MEWRSGLTWRVVLAVIYGAIVLMPVFIWSELMIGPLPVSLTWAVVILFYWLSLMYGSPLTRQELLVMFAAVGTAIYAGTGLNFSGMFYRIWFSESPIAKAYGISDLLPYWYVPENKMIRLQIIRTFLDESWVPILSFSLIFWLLNLAAGLSLGFFFYYLFTEVEKLPFPMARVSVETLTELERRDPEMMRVFMLFAFIGFIYSLVAYGTPSLSQAMLGIRIEIIPFPWLDISEAFQEVLPGAMIGLDTNLMHYILGIILPWNVVISMFISSLFISVIGNPLITWFFPELIPRWVEFPKGMRLPDLLFWSQTYVWYAVSIGVGFGVFAEQVIRGRKGLYRTFKSLYELGGELRIAGGLSIKFIIFVYLAAVIIWLLLLEFILIPGFPILPLIFLIVLWPATFGLITVRAYAETGFYVPPIPAFINNILILTMELNKIPVLSTLGIWPWFAPLMVDNGSGWATTFYICRGVRCTFKSYMKAVFLVATPIAILMNFIYSEYIWKMTPIPSPMFPYAQIFWPINAAQSSLWYTRVIYSMNPLLIISGFIAITGIAFISNILHIPISIVGILNGIAPLPTPLAVFLGALMGKIASYALKGRINLRKYAFMMMGGYAVGFAVAMAIIVSLVIFLKSIWPLPY